MADPVASARAPSLRSLRSQPTLPTLPTPRFDAAPYRLSGTVYGALLNHRDSLRTLGDAVDALPYKGAPRGVVLYVKPRNAFVPAGGAVLVDDAGMRLEAAPMVGLVIGQTASRVREADALAHVAGAIVAIDFSVPHEAFFRPQTRLKARDASFVLGPAVVPLDELGGDVDALGLRVEVDGRLVHSTGSGERVRGAARLIADLSDFITLVPGDLVLAGAAPGAPHVGAGQRVAVAIDGLGGVETAVEADHAADGRAPSSGPAADGRAPPSRPPA